jgi:hypothetical protein
MELEGTPVACRLAGHVVLLTSVFVALSRASMNSWLN